MSDDIIQDIQITLAHQEQQIQDMSEMISAQWQEIERLKRHIKKTEAKLQEMAEGGDGDKALSATDFAAQNTPPHY